MNPIQQNATNVIEKTIGPATALTVSTGWATLWQIVPGVLGSLSCILGMYVTIYLFRQKRRINNLKIAELEKKD